MSKINFLHPIESLGIKQVSLNGIRVERLEDRLDPKVPFPHKHDFYQIIVMEEGGGFHQIDFEKHKVTNHSVFVMKPAQVHSWKLASKVKGFVIEFNLESISRDLRSFSEVMDRLLFSVDVLLLEEKADQDLKNLCREMFYEFQERPVYSETVLTSMLSIFILRLVREMTDHAPPRLKTDDRADKFHRLVEENFQKEHRVEFYARKMNLTPKSLTMQMTRLLGKSPRAIIQDRFMLEAKRLLAFSDMSVADIGFALGFEDPNYFTRFFRQHEKISPAQFRKNLNSSPTKR